MAAAAPRGGVLPTGNTVWTCSLNSDAPRNNCGVAEEQETMASQKTNGLQTPTSRLSRNTRKPRVMVKKKTVTRSPNSKAVLSLLQKKRTTKKKTQRRKTKKKISYPISSQIALRKIKHG